MDQVVEAAAQQRRFQGMQVLKYLLYWYKKGTNTDTCSKCCCWVSAFCESLAFCTSKASKFRTSKASKLRTSKASKLESRAAAPLSRNAGTQFLLVQKYLLYWYKVQIFWWGAAAPLSKNAGDTKFTCFTGTSVLALLVQKYLPPSTAAQQRGFRGMHEVLCFPHSLTLSLSIYMYIYIYYMYVCMYVCMYVWMYIHTCIYA